MEHMTIGSNATYELLEQKSRFVCFISPLVDEHNAKLFINNYKEEYKTATHVVPVYAVIENQRPLYYYSDDGEPPKTAGYPIVSIIEKQHLINIACVVIRYFGGIKLGTGGLVRAYSKSFLNALHKTKIIPYIQYINIQLIFNNYSIQKKIESIIGNYHGFITRKKYRDDIEFTVSVSKKTLAIIKNELDHLKVTVKIAP